MHSKFRDVPVQNKTTLVKNTTKNWTYLTLLPVLVFNIRIHSFSSGIKKLLNFLDTRQAIKIIPGFLPSCCWVCFIFFFKKKKSHSLLPLLQYSVLCSELQNCSENSHTSWEVHKWFCNHLTAQMEWMQVTSLQGGKKRALIGHLGECASHPRKARQPYLPLHDQDWFVILQSLQLSPCFPRCRHTEVQLEGFNFSNCNLQLFALTKLSKTSIWSQLCIFTTL